jgi:RNA polymerase sigma-70 factor (ECF subfamily)
MYDDLTNLRGAGPSFPTTDWILIEEIKTHKHDERALIDLLLGRYWTPVYCYIRREGYRNEEAEDLTQGFFHEVVLNHHFVERADPSKGRFRSFLLHALKQYLLNEKAKQGARMRIPGSRLIPLDEVDLQALPASILRSNAENSYYYAWISALLDRVLSEVKEACCADGLKTHWEVFSARIVRPILDNTKPPPLKKLCAQFGIASCGKASNMAITVKRRFRAALRQHICNTVGCDDNVDAELDDLLRFLPRAAQDHCEPPGITL